MDVNFSIIIPHYNSPELLVRCLQSIPVREDIQVIVIDDCSPDAETYKVRFAEFSRPYLEWYSTPKGGCPGRARNIGLDHAVGKWVLFIDADDYYTDNLVPVLSEYVSSDYDVIYFKEDSIDEITGKQSDRHKTRNNCIDAFLSGNVSAREAALWHTAIVALMVSRSYIEAHHIRFDEILIAEDVMYAAKLACFSERLHFTDIVLYMVTTRASGFHNSAFVNIDKYVTYQKVVLQFSRFIQQYGSEQTKPCMLKVLQDSFKKYGMKGFRIVLRMLLQEHALFYGFGEYLKRKIC